LTQGYEANHSGQFLESIVEREFASRGFIVRDHVEDADNLDLFAPRVLIRRVPYCSTAEIDGHTEFVVADYSRKIRLECKWQGGSGSADERLYYTLRQAELAYPEKEVLILYGGGGAREGIMRDIKRMAFAIAHKKVWVLNINEFPQWVKQQFVRAEAA
jgi:hypothetical protein